MGQRTSQRILTCSICERVPEDGKIYGKCAVLSYVLIA